MLNLFKLFQAIHLALQASQWKFNENSVLLDIMFIVAHEIVKCQQDGLSQDSCYIDYHISMKSRCSM